MEGRRVLPVRWSAFGAEVAARDEVHVEVRDGHAGVFADVEGEAIAAVGDALRFGDLVRDSEHAGERGGVVVSDVTGVGDVLSWG